MEKGVSMLKKIISIFFITFLICSTQGLLYSQDIKDTADDDNEGVANSGYPKPTNKYAKISYQERKRELKEEKKELEEELKGLVSEHKNTLNKRRVLTDSLIVANDRETIDELIKEREEEMLKAATLAIAIKEQKIKIERLRQDIKQPFDGYFNVDGKYNWEKTFDISDVEKVRQGTWSIHAKAKNNLDYWSDEVAINVKIDPKANIPTLNVINPRPNARVQGNLMIVGTAFDNEAIEKIIFFLDDEEEPRVCKGTEYWEYLLNTVELKDGIHTLRFRVYDNEEIHSKDHIIPFYLDRRTPVITFDNIRSGKTLSKTINVEGTVTNDNGVVEVSYSTDDRYSFKKASMKSLQKNNVEVAFKFPLNAKQLPNGIQTIWVKAKNRTGSEAYASLNITIEDSDEEASFETPVVYIDRPAIDGERFSDVVIITGIALSNSEIKSVLYRLDRGRIYINENGDVVESKEQEYSKWYEATLSENKENWEIFVENGKMPSGEHIIEVYAVNIDEAKSDIKTVKFQLDYENPVISILSPRSGSYLKNEQIILGRAQDPNGISEVSISLNSGWSFQIANGKENWNYYLNSKSLPDGLLKFLIKAKDNCGSESYSFAVYNIDNTPPSVSILFPRIGEGISNIYKVEGRAHDNTKLEGVYIKIVDENNNNMLPKGKTDEDGYVEANGKDAWYYEIDTTKWTPMYKYFIMIKAVDSAGNVTEKSSFFLVSPLSDLPTVELDHPQSNQNMTGDVLQFYGTAHANTELEGVYIKIDNGEFKKANGTTVWQYACPATNLTEGLHTITVIATKKQTDPNVEPKTSGPILRTFYYQESGAIINVTSHINGKPIPHRPWLRGTTEYYEKDIELKMKKEIQTRKFYQFKKRYVKKPELVPEIDQIHVSKFEVMNLVAQRKAKNKIKNLSLTIDNGNTFDRAIMESPKKWLVRLQSQYLIDGNHTIQFKATTNSNKSTMQFFKITVDRKLPLVAITTPLENTRHSGRIAIKGTADDENNEITEVKLLFRQFDKDAGKLPKFIEGIYLWAQVFSGPLISTGVGLSFFDDIVRLEALFGWFPSRTNIKDMGIPDSLFLKEFGWTNGQFIPKYSGFTTGGKLLARVINIPFEFLFGEDAKNFSWSIEIGAGFFWTSGFSGSLNKSDNDEYIKYLKNPGAYSEYPEKPKVVAGFMLQWDFFKVERYRGFRKFALYFEASFFFIASEIRSELVPQIGFGVRNALF